jgi:arylsulfatase A-like enzyme
MRFAFSLVALWFSILISSVAESKPNFVFVLVDDQAYYDLGCYDLGCYGATEFKTPRIDAMAAAGVRFTDYYAAAPICSPSRAGLPTGCYPRRVGNETWVHVRNREMTRKLRGMAIMFQKFGQTRPTGESLMVT